MDAERNIISKAAWRDRCRRLRPVTAAESAAVQRRVLAQEWWGMAFCAGMYRSKPGEISTEAIWADALRLRMRVAVPVRAAGAAGYGWGEVTESSRWHQGAFGILEPDGARRMAASALRVVVVPGLAFDRNGVRLGHGGGFFDRLLAHANGLRVGLCLERMLVPELPAEAYDARMDVLVTENRVLYMPSAAVKWATWTG